MKKNPTRIAATVWLLLTLGAIYPTQAVPITYSYSGNPYGQTTLPGVTGLTLGDYMTVSFTMDSALWGTPDCLVSGGLINSGPFQVGFDSAKVTTDAAGAMVAWSLFGAGRGMDLFTFRQADGSGKDTIFVTVFDGTVVSSGGAQVEYQAGSGSGWRVAGVPDASYSLLLLSFSLVVLLGFWHSQRHQEPVRRQAR